MNLTRLSPQSHIEALRPTMLGGVVQGLLQDTEKTKRNLCRDGAGQVVASEVDLHSLMLAELFAEAPHSCSQAQVLQPGRVQLVRQGLDILGYFGGLLPQFVDEAEDFNRRIGQVPFELIDRD